MKTLRYFLMPLLLSLPLLTWTGCDQLYGIAKDVYSSSSGSASPSLTEIISGLKEALTKDADGAINSLGKPGGFLNDAGVKIPFPQEAQFVSTKLKEIGMGKMVDEFEKLLNQGAEEGVKTALPIFSGAIQQMTFNDAKSILFGNDDAATNYFKGATTNQLTTAFSPHIKSALDKVNATKAWEKLASTYNSIPLVNKKVETDLVKYATAKALDGLFLKIAQEEKQIRQSPALRTTATLKKVFDYADKYRKK